MGTVQTVWGWQPALYLFLGGMGAGTGLIACILYYRDKEKLRGVIRASFWAAAISIIVGLLLLLLELTNPLRGMLMWQSFSHMGSWMTFGAWAAFLAIVVFGLSALLMTIRDKAEQKSGQPDVGRDRRLGNLMKVFAPLGIVLGLAVAAYTGILLMCADVPLWSTGLLPCLFTVSAIDTGVALVEIIFIATHAEQTVGAHTLQLLERAAVVLIPIEAVILTIFLIVAGVGGSDAASLAAAGSVKTLLLGELAPWFWLIMVACGLIVPFIIARSGVKRMRAAETSPVSAASANVDPDSARASVAVTTPLAATTDSASAPARVQPSNPYASAAVGAALALVGGCALRFLILAAGVHADYVLAAVASFL